MQNKMVNIGFGNMVPFGRVVALVSNESAPTKRSITDARERGMLVDATQGRKTRAVIVTDSGHIILSAIHPETIANRFNAEAEHLPGMLVIISGPSGSGKGTVVKRLDPQQGFALSISMTTRNPRPGEIHGRDYFFTTEEEFSRMRRDNELLEHIMYVGNFYGTPRHYVEEQIANEKVLVLEIDVNGALRVKEHFPQAVLIFLIPPSLTELSRRLVERNTEDSVTIEDRLKKASDEIALIPQYHYLVVNDEVEKAVEMINHIVAAERLRPSRNEEAIKKFLGV